MIQLNQIKRRLIAILIIGLSISIQAQEFPNPFRNGAPPKAGFMHLSFGSDIASAASIDGFNASNSLIGNLGFTYFLWTNQKNIGLGAQTNLGYGVGSKNGTESISNPIKGQSQTKNISNFNSGGELNQSLFRVQIGPELHYYIGRLGIVPACLVGYQSLSRDAINFSQTIEIPIIAPVPGYSGTIATYASPELNQSGLLITPKIKLQYMLSEMIGIWGEGQYNMGPSSTVTSIRFVPNGVPQDGVYTAKQIQAGNLVTETKTSSYSSMGVNLGISIKFDWSKGGNSSVKNNNGSADNTKQISCPTGYSMINGVCVPDKADPNKKIEFESPFFPRSKGWDGTIKNLFELKNLDVVLPSNTSNTSNAKIWPKIFNNLPKLVEIKGKQHLAFEGKNGTDYYPIDNSNPASISIRPGTACLNSGCKSCTGASGECLCASPASGSGTEHPLSDCIISITKPITDYFKPELVNAIDLNFESDGTTLTSVSVQDIKNLILVSIPKAKFEAVEIIKEGKDRAIFVRLNDEGTPRFFIRPIKKGMTGFRDVFWYETYCIGVCSETIPVEGGTKGVGSITSHTECTAPTWFATGGWKCPCTIPGGCTITVRKVYLRDMLTAK